MAVGICGFSAATTATEIRVVRFFVQPELTVPPCVARTSWSSQTTFHNTTDAPQVVGFLGVSNGDVQVGAQSLQLAPRQTVALYPGDQQLKWEPAQFNPLATLWVNRLDVPLGVIVANRVVASIFEPPVGTDPGHLPCTGTQTAFAGLPLPVVSSLTAPGVPQYFLGTDVGSKAGNEPIDGRLNIGVYNGGASAATAEVRVFCTRIDSLTASDTLLQADQVVIPANAVAQKTVLASTLASRCPNPGLSLWYATATVDQPSFAYAIGLANGTLPKFPGTVALTYTGN
jgi:hypothetical protein